MADKSFAFNSYLIEKNRNGEYTFPLKALEVTEKECSQKCDEVRSKIFILFKDLPRCPEPEYRIFLEDGKLLDLLKPLKEQIDIEQNKLPDLYLATKVIHLIEALAELQARHNNAKIQEKNAKMEAKIKREEQEKRDSEIALLAELGKKLTDPINFRRVIGKDVLNVINSEELQLPQPYSLSDEELTDLKEMIKAFNRLQKKHSIANEAGTVEQVSIIIESALYFICEAFVQKEYIIKPFLEFEKYGAGIERRVDSVVYKGVLPQIICFSEMKYTDNDLSEGLMQNADQMRAFCLCNKQTKTAGIVSNGVFWYFTSYEIMGQNDKFEVSKRFIVLKSKEKLGFFYMGKEVLEFFPFLIGFIQANMKSIP